jgi:hypothetical protein
LKVFFLFDAVAGANDFFSDSRGLDNVVIPKK